MEGRVCNTETESIDRNISDFSEVNSLNDSEVASPVCSLGEPIASIDPDVLIVTTSIYKSWNVLGGLRFSKFLRVVHVYVRCHFLL